MSDLKLCLTVSIIHSSTIIVEIYDKFLYKVDTTKLSLSIQLLGYKELIDLHRVEKVGLNSVIIRGMAVKCLEKNTFLYLKHLVLIKMIYLLLKTSNDIPSLDG